MKIIQQNLVVSEGVCFGQQSACLVWEAWTSDSEARPAGALSPDQEGAQQLGERGGDGCRSASEPVWLGLVTSVNCVSTYALVSQAVLEVEVARGNNRAVLLEAAIRAFKVENGMDPNHSREPLQLFPFHLLHLVSSVFYSIKQFFNQRNSA